MAEQVKWGDYYIDKELLVYSDKHSNIKFRMFLPHAKQETHLGYIVRAKEYATWEVHVDSRLPGIQGCCFSSPEEARNQVQLEICKYGLKEIDPLYTTSQITLKSWCKSHCKSIAKKLALTGLLIYFVGSVIDLGLDSPHPSGIFAFTTQEIFTGLTVTFLVLALPIYLTGVIVSRKAKNQENTRLAEKPSTEYNLEQSQEIPAEPAQPQQA